MLATRSAAKGCCHTLDSSQAILLPFLFQTRTIARTFTTSHPVQQDDTQSGNDGLDRLVDSSERARTNDARLNSSRRPQKRPRQSKVGVDRTRSIPFEGKVPSAHLGVRVEGSTMTPRELRIFEELFKAKQVQPEEKAGEKQKRKQKHGKKGFKPESQGYGVVATPTVREFPDILRPLAEEAAALRARGAIENDAKTSGEQTMPGTQQSEAATKELNSTKLLMDNAQTDADLWEVLQDQVFGKIKRLPESSDTAQSSHDFQVLTQTLPQSLLHFMKTIQTSFPGSSLGLVLLPTLKKLGPSAFALGASTELFNEHMLLLYIHYADLGGIDETLSEMDKNVYEFDAGTKALVDTIQRDGHRSVKNVYGPGMQALWSTDRKTRGLEKIRRWGGIIDGRLQSAALKAALQRQPGPSEDEEEDDQKLSVA